MMGGCFLFYNFYNTMCSLSPLESEPPPSVYAEYAHKGLAKSRTHFKSYMAPASDGRSEKVGRVNTHTYLVWTEKGRKFIHDLAHRFWELAELYEVKNL